LGGQTRSVFSGTSVIDPVKGRDVMANQSKTIWVYGDIRTERFHRFSLNVLAGALKLARGISGDAAVVLLDTDDSGEPQAGATSSCGTERESAAKDFFEHGASRVVVLESPQLSEVRADIHAAVLAEAVKSLAPRLVLFPLSAFCREVASRTARICNAGLIADCLDFRVESQGIKALCPSWGGEILAEIGYSDPAQTGFATVQPHAFKAAKTSDNGGRVERVAVGPVKLSSRIKRLSSCIEPDTHRKLQEAEVVVVGGAGLSTAENFSWVRQLAAFLGGEVGATRPPVLQHWVHAERLIGQTGKKVRPKLLISVGTSGAVQYTAGIMESKTVMAINRDPASPIFQVADIGVVADAKSLMPILLSKVRQRVMRNLADSLADSECQLEGFGFGAKVQKLRESHGWSFEALAEATGQSPEFIQQVERNEISPSVSFLLRLAGALKVDPGTFLRDEEKIKIRDMRTQAYEKRTQSYNYQTLTDGAESDHLRAFLVTIESRQTHKPVAYKHEGEEFIYVLEGHVELTLGGKIHGLKPGESIHFNSDAPHKLKNLSNETTRLLVVLYTI
jgi:electron transfer flavoprotein alpha subunit